MTNDQSKISWIGVDWGTTNFRAYALSASDQILDSVESSDGMLSVANRKFEATLLQQIQPWLSDKKRTPVVMSGMVGARQGWVEAAYRSTPCSSVSSDELTQVKTIDDRVSVFIAPGVSQAEPADVMRGEETQIFGLLQLQPKFEGVICLPGTHSKWVAVSDSKIKKFQTWMTGELFDLLKNQSVLKHSADTNEWSQTAFEESARRALSSPDDMLGTLFSIRAADLLNGTTKDFSVSSLSGLLIGAECVSALSQFSHADKSVALIGSETVANLYSQVIDMAGSSSTIFDVSTMTLSGLKAVAHNLSGENVA